MKVNVNKLRRDAYDCRYSHLVIEPHDVLQLCDEIVKLRAKVTELGGDPLNLDAPPSPETQASEGHKVAQQPPASGDAAIPEEPPQPAATEQEPAHTDDSEPQ